MEKVSQALQENLTLPHPDEYQDDNIRAMAFLVLGVFVFSLQDLLIKALSDSYPVHQLMFVRACVALFPMLVIVHFDARVSSLKTKRPWLHLLRGVLVLIAYTSFYLGLAVMKLADAVALFFSAPLFITALSVPFLGEKVGARRWIAIFVGLMGVVVILRPGMGLFEPAAILPVICALTYAMGQIIARRLGKTESGSCMAFYMILANLIGGLILMAAFSGIEVHDEMHGSMAFLLRPWAMPSLEHFGMMAANGLIAAVGFFCLTQAYRIGQATLVAPFEYTAMIWAVLWGYLIFDNLPDVYTIAGVALVVGSGFYVIHRERARGQKLFTWRGLLRAR